MKDAISSMSLDYKKWRLDSQELISDFTSAGLTSENRFDQLFAASTIGGPNEKFESIPPMSNRYLTCGQTPFISFYYAIEVNTFSFFLKLFNSSTQLQLYFLRVLASLFCLK